MSELTADEKLKRLEPLFYEINRRAEKEWADDGYDFTITIDADMWKEIKDVL